VPGEEAPSAAAELHIMKIPASDPQANPGTREISTSASPASPLLATLRRAGFAVQARMTVPAANAGEMLAMLRNVALAVTWAVTVIITLAVAIPAGVPADAIIAIVAIELIGFAVGALSLRHKRPTD
jgi:hypothetical protein